MVIVVFTGLIMNRFRFAAHRFRLGPMHLTSANTFHSQTCTNKTNTNLIAVLIDFGLTSTRTFETLGCSQLKLDVTTDILTGQENSQRLIEIDTEIFHWMFRENECVSM